MERGLHERSALPAHPGTRQVRDRDWYQVGHRGTAAPAWSGHRLGDRLRRATGRLRRSGRGRPRGSGRPGRGGDRERQPDP